MTRNVLGLDLDPKTRCIHYHGPLDIIAIKATLLLPIDSSESLR